MVQVVQNEKDLFVSAFDERERARGARGPAWLAQLRRRAIDYFSQTGFPSLRDEDWKYTNVAPIARHSFTLSRAEDAALEAAALGSVDFANLSYPRAVFVNGHFSQKLSSLDGLPSGVVVQSLARVLEEKPEEVEPFLGRCVSYSDHAFNALNAAFLSDGAYVRVGAKEVVETPIHLIYLAEGENFVCHPRNLFVAEAGSQLTVIETYVGLSDGTYFTNGVTETILAENAVVDHYKVQKEGPAAFHVATSQSQQGRSSSLRTCFIALGGLLVRNNVNAVLDGEGADCGLNGLYLLGGDQHVDNHTRLEHAKPHCGSRELYKGVLDVRSRAVFHGRIVVHPGAQKTDSKQTNNNLILSDQALVNTKPQLEIYADDVKCTHGATIGQLDQDALFYLRSRGMEKQTAQSLLIYAFAGELVQKVRPEELRNRLGEYLFHWLPSGELVREAV